MSLPYSVIPTILELGIITPVSQIRKMKQKKMEVEFSKLFRDTIESDTQLCFPWLKDKALEVGDDVGPTQPSRDCGLNIMAHLEPTVALLGTWAWECSRQPPLPLDIRRLTGTSQAKCVLLEQSPWCLANEACAFPFRCWRNPNALSAASWNRCLKMWMRKNASCWSSSGVPPKAWIPCSATCRTKFTKSEGPRLTCRSDQGHLTSSFALCFRNRSPVQARPRSLSRCLYT